MRCMASRTFIKKKEVVIRKEFVYNLWLAMLIASVVYSIPTKLLKIVLRYQYAVSPFSFKKETKFMLLLTMPQFWTASSQLGLSKRHQPRRISRYIPIEKSTPERIYPSKRYFNFYDVGSGALWMQNDSMPSSEWILLIELKPELLNLPGLWIA